jgi:hypothetical protein
MPSTALPHALADLLSGVQERESAAVQQMVDDWHEEYAPALVELVGFSGPSKSGSVRILETHTGQALGEDVRAWRRWLWARSYSAMAEDIDREAKHVLYSRLDERIAALFATTQPARVRFDEIVLTGDQFAANRGVQPSLWMAGDQTAGMLSGGDLVVGASFRGDERAYSLDALLEHRIILDVVGGTPIVIVACPLLHMVSAFDLTTAAGLGQLVTSGLAHRLATLLVDDQAHSAWSVDTGEAVFGPAASDQKRLSLITAVTVCTFRAWHLFNPDTTVGIVSSARAASARLEADAVAMTGATTDEPQQPVLWRREFMRQHPVHSITVNRRNFVAVASTDGAIRVYDAVRPFPDQPASTVIIDVDGLAWSVRETELLASHRSGAQVHSRRRLAREVLADAWLEQHPETKVVR